MRFDGKQLLTAVVAVAVAGGGLAARELTSGGDARPARTVAGEQEISPTGQVLLDLLDRGRDGTYRARYQIRGMQGAGAGAPWLEVYRKGRNRYRQDASATETQQGGQRTYVVDGAVTRCLQAGQVDPWTCEPVGGAAERPDQLVENLREELRGAQVSELEPRTIGGREARCFAFSTAGGSATELCADRSGIPLLVSYADHAIELVSLTPVVADRDFVPPGQLR